MRLLRASQACSPSSKRLLTTSSSDPPRTRARALSSRCARGASPTRPCGASRPYSTTSEDRRLYAARRVSLCTSSSPPLPSPGHGLTVSLASPARRRHSTRGGRVRTGLGGRAPAWVSAFLVPLASWRHGSSPPPFIVQEQDNVLSSRLQDSASASTTTNSTRHPTTNLHQ
jgi:hypothetical protein